MKIRFKDIPRSLPFTFRDGIKAVRGAGNHARAQLFPKPAKPDTVFIRDVEVCEITDILADMNNLGRFGIPPRPDTTPQILAVANYSAAEKEKARKRANLDMLAKVMSPKVKFWPLTDDTPEGE